MTSSVLLRWLQRGFLVLGLPLLGVWLEAAYESRSFQSAESWKLEAARLEAATRPLVPNAAAAVGAAYTGPAPPPRQPAAMEKSTLGRIEIPRLGIRAIMAEGVDTKTLGRAVGHVAWTALPGSPGNCALAGHRDTFLRGLGGVRIHDVIRLVTPEHTFIYEVVWSAVVEPRQVEVLDSTAVRSLTLVTCFPFEFIGAAPQRFVVRAREIASQLPHRFTQGRSATQGGSENE